MSSLFFWKTWPFVYRSIFYAVAGVFVLTFCFTWFSFFYGAEGVIHWEKLEEQKVLESTVHTFQAGPFELSVPGENYVIFEYFNGSQISVNTTASYLFIFALGICAMMILTIITTLERFWYYVGIAVFILFIISLRLEVLSLFGQRNQIPAIAIISLFTLLSFYFHTLRSSIPFIKRFLAFLGLIVLTTIVLYYFSEVLYPMLHLSVTSYTPGLIVCVIFIFMVAHEIPASFVYMASQGNSKSLRHFTIISTIYLFNIVVSALHEMGTIHWNFIYINPYLLLSISAILGLWGFRLREPRYENILEFFPYGAFFYLSIGAICFGTIAYLLGSANDVALRIVRDAILFSHAGYGVIFFTYVISNFLSMLSQNLPAYKILYKPNRMPYFTFRLAGLVAVLALVFFSNWHEYVYNSISGFYINLGDLYLKLEKSATAEAYYEQGRSYGFQNNHSNYALAQLKAARVSFDGAHYNYEHANALRPTEFSLINAGNLFSWENKRFDAIKSFRAAEKLLPHAGPIQNNLGLAYTKVHALDSAVFFLNEARNHSISKSSAEINFFGLAAMDGLPLKTDSILQFFNTTSPAVVSNALALATSQQQEFKTEVTPLADKKLNLFTATLLNNYIIRNAKTVDTTFVHQAYLLASDSLNQSFSEALKSSLAFAYYHQGNVFKALQLLGEMAYVSQNYSGKYNYIMGLWALEQSNPELADSYFNYAVLEDYKQAKLYKAIALSEDGQVQQALIAWDSVANSKEEGEKEMAARMKRILTLNLHEIQSLSDPEKYQFCRYQLNVHDTEIFDRVVNSIQDANYKAKALLDMAQRQLEFDALPQALHYFQQIGGLKLTDKDLYEDIRHTELRLLAERKDLQELAKQINKGIDFGKGFNLEKIYYTALFAEASNDTLKAEINFQVLANYNPYFEEGIIAASNFYRMHCTNRMKAYTILAEALQVNNNSVKLLKAYTREALRIGFDEYAGSALQRIEVIRAKRIRKH